MHTKGSDTTLMDTWGRPEYINWQQNIRHYR